MIFEPIGQNFLVDPIALEIPLMSRFVITEGRTGKKGEQGERGGEVIGFGEVEEVCTTEDVKQNTRNYMKFLGSK